MAYVGGKSKGATHIIDTLNKKKFDSMKYLEPFVGYGHILRRVENKKSYTASDCNKLLISLLSGIQNNLKYPKVTKRRYAYLKKDVRNFSFERAIAAFCYSYNGKEWGGYTIASSSGERSDYPAERKRYYDKLKNNDIFKKTLLQVKSYSDFKPRGYLIYCDPPYKDTTGYNCGADFNHDKFWNTMRKWSANNTVYISEYTAPPDFKCVARSEKHSSLSGSGAKETRIEKLFKYRAPRKVQQKSTPA